MENISKSEFPNPLYSFYNVTFNFNKVIHTYISIYCYEYVNIPCFVCIFIEIPQMIRKIFNIYILRYICYINAMKIHLQASIPLLLLSIRNIRGYVLVKCLTKFMATLATKYEFWKIQVLKSHY